MKQVKRTDLAALRTAQAEKQLLKEKVQNIETYLAAKDKAFKPKERPNK